jgi:hypothetical protein
LKKWRRAKRTSSARKLKIILSFEAAGLVASVASLIASGGAAKLESYNYG